MIFLVLALNIQGPSEGKRPKGEPDVTENGTVHVTGNLLLEFFSFSSVPKKSTFVRILGFFLRCSWLFMITL